MPEIRGQNGLRPRLARKNLATMNNAKLDEAIRILKGDDLRTVVDTHFDRLDCLYAGELLERPFGLSGVWGTATSNSFTHPEDCIAEQLVSLATVELDKLKCGAVFRPGITGVGLYGVHFMDVLLGAEVFDLDGTGNWQVHTLTTAVGTLELPNWAQHPAWQTAARAAEFFVEHAPGSVVFETPCISSPLNIAINLYGQEFLMALLEEPEAAHHDMRVITDLMLGIHGWYIERVPWRQRQAAAIGRVTPPGFGHLCRCSATMLSEEQYLEFVMPYEREVLALFPRGGFMHLCGFYTQLIPAWQHFDELKVLQVNDDASADLPEYFRRLPDDRVFYNLECPQMPWREAERLTSGCRIVHTCATNTAEAWSRDFAAAANAGEFELLRAW